MEKIKASVGFMMSKCKVDSKELLNKLYQANLYSLEHYGRFIYDDDFIYINKSVKMLNTENFVLTLENIPSFTEVESLELSKSDMISMEKAAIGELDSIYKINEIMFFKNKNDNDKLTLNDFSEKTSCAELLKDYLLNRYN